jgi:hypothetical protein
MTVRKISRLHKANILNFIMFGETVVIFPAPKTPQFAVIGLFILKPDKSIPHFAYTF